MRLSGVWVLCTVLFTGVYGNLVRHVSLNVGSTFTVSVNTLLNTDVICHLETPKDGNIEFKPGDQNKTTHKYQILEGIPNISLCMLTILNLDGADEGIWTMSYTSANGTGSQIYNITVNIADNQETSEIEDINGIILTKIVHLTRRGMSIDVSLNRESFHEDCYVQNPNGEMIKADLLNIENVTVQNSSNFVSCRITIGPMSEELLGDWRVCGQSETKGMRCQPANIAWNNNNSDAQWDSIVRTMVRQPVHIGGALNSGVEGRGNVLNCHVITPAGEDLVVSGDVQYPHIERLPINNPSLCSILFTNIDHYMIGNWSVYGTFRSVLSGLQEDRLPLNFFLYNENNPQEQAYNVTVLPDVRQLVNLNTSVDMEVSGTGMLEHCQVIMPSGKALVLNGNESDVGVSMKSLTTVAACNIRILSITNDKLGKWEITTKFINGHKFDEKIQSFYIIQEDPENPIVEEHRVIENMTERVIVDEKLGETHSFIINSNSLTINESCHILTPSGRQYAFIPGFNVANVDIIQQNSVECGVMVHFLTPDMIGTWTLIARSTRLSVPIERRLSFTIRVEETFSLGHAINITEGLDLYIRLPNETDVYRTCKLYKPNGEEAGDYLIDVIRRSFCGYIIKEVGLIHSGVWKIVYGQQITYTGTIEVNVLESHTISFENQNFTQGSPVKTIVGPKDAEYCKLEDNNYNTVFNGFGPCVVELERATIEHSGLWTAYVNVPGRVFIQQSKFRTAVKPAHTSESIVTSHVERFLTVTVLSCAIPESYEMHSCKFRNPLGNILVAKHGVGEITGGGYLESVGTDIRANNCTIEIRNPKSTVIGIWRCTVDTDKGTYFGFLGVNRVEDIAIVPELRPDQETNHRFVGETLEMSCSIDAAIKYCYFRHENGTLINVSPADPSSDFRYVGEGFDAGVCGVQIKNVQMSHYGRWSCNVGYRNGQQEIIEKRSFIYVITAERMRLSRFEEMNSGIALEVSINHMEYCRFVRNDGVGFNNYNATPGYEIKIVKSLPDICKLWIFKPAEVDRLPWTVAVKMINVDKEFIITTGSLSTRNDAGNPTLLMLIWVLLIIMGVLSFVLGITSLLSTTNAKEWTQNRTSHLRTSLRNFIWKKPQSNPEIIVTPRI